MVVGDIKIDKFDFYIRLRNKEELIRQFQVKCNKVFKKHFPYGGCWCRYTNGILKFSLTPTRYMSVKGSNSKNLEMLPENELYDLFEEAGFYDEDNAYLVKDMVISKLDLTKDIVVDELVTDYVDCMHECYFPHGHVTSKNYSGIGSGKSLYITVPTRSGNKDNDFVGDKKYMFYDKARELNMKEIKLRYMLSEEEQKLIPDGFYNPDSGILKLEGLNLMRVECHFHNSNKLDSVADKILNDYGNKNLSLEMVLYLLSIGKLYERLDYTYKEQLKRDVFPCFDKVDMSMDMKPEHRILIEQFGRVPYHLFEHIYRGAGLKSPFANLFQKKIIPYVYGRNFMYQEIIGKLGIVY